MYTSTPLSSSPTPSTFTQDIQRTFAPGLRFGGIQGLPPLLLLLLAIAFPTISPFYFSFAYVAPADLAFAVWRDGPGAYFHYPTIPLLVGLLPVLATGIVDIIASRRAKSTRTGILTCLWANLWFLLATTIGFLGVNAFFTLQGLGLPLDRQLQLLATDLGIMLLLAVVLSLLCGWIGSRQAASIAASQTSAAPSTAALDLATQNQLGPLFGTYTSTQPSRAFATGLGTVAIVILLFVVQRFVLHISGSDIFVDAVAAIAGIVATVNQAYKRRGQQVAVFQQGMIVPTGSGQTAAMRWGEIDTMRSQFTDTVIRLTTKQGFTVVLPNTFEGFADLKATLMRQINSSQVSS